MYKMTYFLFRFHVIFTDRYLKFASNVPHIRLVDISQLNKAYVCWTLVVCAPSDL